MKNRKYHLRTALVATGLLLTGILLLSLFLGTQAVWHCSPTEPRASGVEAWESAIVPAQPPEEANEAFFDSFTVSSDDRNYFLEYPSGNPPSNVFPYELIETKPDELLHVGGGTLAFYAMGTAYFNATQTTADEAAYHYCDARMRSLTDEQARKLEGRRLTENGWNLRFYPFPAVRFGFRHQGIEDLKFNSLKVFDARTRKLISDEHYRNERARYHYWFRSHIPLWHRTPVDLVLDISHGPSKVFEFSPRAGEGFSEGSFKCRLIHAFEGVDAHRYRDSGRTVVHTLRRSLSDTADLKFIFACQPAASQMPVSFEFLDQEGNSFRKVPHFGSRQKYLHQVTIRQPLEKVALIRARYRTRRKRIVIHLPYIHGLPEENNVIDDLFDTYVPYISLRSPDQVAQFLRQALQLKPKIGRQRGPIPPDSINNSILNNNKRSVIPFPVEFSDVTVREIAQVYAEGGDLYVDVENERLSLEYPTTIWVKLRQFLRRMTWK
jgi:hypothetical protein